MDNTSKARNTDPRYSKLTIGVCPDQWGVWFPWDEKQIPWDKALAEMAEAGFSVMETGPFGYFPTNPKLLKVVMDAYDFKVVAGTAWGVLHKEEAWPTTEAWFRQVAETHAAVGAEYIVHLPPMFRDEHTGEFTDVRHLDGAAWDLYVDNANKLGRIMKDDYGLQMVLHPHGDSHIETREDIDRIFQATDPEYVGFCLDTGHIVYGMADNIELIRTRPVPRPQAPVSPEDELLPELPAIAIDGPKGVGKTETLRRRAATTVTLDTIAQGELYRAYPERRELYAALAASCATR